MSNSAIKTMSATTTAANKGIVRRLYKEGFEAGDPSILSALYSSDCVDTRFGGLDGAVKTLTDLRHAYDSVHFEIEDMIAEGDKVVVRATVRVGDKVGCKRISAISIYTLRHGLIVEACGHSDSFF